MSQIPKVSAVLLRRGAMKGVRGGGVARAPLSSMAASYEKYPIAGDVDWERLAALTQDPSLLSEKQQHDEVSSSVVESDTMVLSSLPDWNGLAQLTQDPSIEELSMKVQGDSMHWRQTQVDIERTVWREYLGLESDSSTNI